MDGTNIREVTSKGITYVDDDGQEQFIDFEACYQNYLKRFEDPHFRERLRQLNKLNVIGLRITIKRLKAWREVGARNVLGPPWDNGPYIEFHTEPPIRFQFETREDMYDLLLDTVRKAGWQTFDLS
ncbi:MAG: hypothetical protein HY862_19995 [Chloroflexi bacterium]|nr:hypothetical protein [Chloroflexota bacterium]